MPGPRKLLDWVLTIAIAIGFVLVFEAEVAKPYRIPSSSMEPTLHCARPSAWCEARFSDRVIVNRLAYRFEDPKRGQIVVFDAPAAAKALCGEGGTFVKRLIGLPGETVSEASGGIISIDGRPLREPYAFDRTQDLTTGTWDVPKGEYFFMGDDRPHTCDSRTWGSVPRNRLIGPLILTYWPPNRVALH
ncbi:MAG: signal peptidase I [Gaiellaceae bacterium]